MADNTQFGNFNIWDGNDNSPIRTIDINEERRDIDISSEISRYWPEENPFISILMRASTNPVGSKRFSWWEKDRPEWWTELTDDHTDSADTIEVDDAHFLNPKDLIKNVETGEIFFIKEIAESGDNYELTVERAVTEDSASGWGTSAQASDGTDDEIFKLGNAMEENSRAPEAWATQPVKKHNYVQTFRDPFEGSNDAQSEGVRAGPDERQRLRREKLFEHRTNIERQIIFGERKEWYDSTEDKVRRMTGGIMQFLRETTGVTVYDLASENNGVLTETEWKSFLSEGMKHGSRNKLFLTSRMVAQRLDEHAASRIETTSGEEMYGLNLQTYLTTHGQVAIATTELFENAYGSIGLLLDIGNLEFRPFAGEESSLKTNIEENDRDGWKDEYMTKAGLKLELPKTHAILEGVA